jgi:hypothetical protein
MKKKYLSLLLLVILGSSACSQPDLEDVALFHERWDHIDQEEKASALSNSDAYSPEWNTPAESVRWNNYIRAHRLGYQADRTEEYFVEWMREILVEEGFEDPLYSCVGYTYPDAADAMRPAIDALEELGITMMDYVCLFVMDARKHETFSRQQAELGWLNSALEDFNSR